MCIMSTYLLIYFPIKNPSLDHGAMNTRQLHGPRTVTERDITPELISHQRRFESLLTRL